MKIDISVRDLKALRALGETLAAEVLTEEEFQILEGRKVPTSAVLVINMPEPLGFGTIGSQGEAIERVIKRLSSRQRFWTRSTLAEKVLDTIKPQPGQSVGALKTAITKRITQLRDRGSILVLRISE